MNQLIVGKSVKKQKLNFSIIVLLIQQTFYIFNVNAGGPHT